MRISLLEAKNLKRILVIVLLLASAFSANAFAQTKKTKSTRKPPVAKPVPPDFSAERAKVGIQISNVTKFIYVYGKVVNGLEFAAEQAKTNPVTDVVAAKTPAGEGWGRREHQ